MCRQRYGNLVNNEQLAWMRLVIEFGHEQGRQLLDEVVTNLENVPDFELGAATGPKLLARRCQEGRGNAEPCRRAGITLPDRSAARRHDQRRAAQNGSAVHNAATALHKALTTTNIIAKQKMIQRRVFSVKICRSIVYIDGDVVPSPIAARRIRST